MPESLERANAASPVTKPAAEEESPWALAPWLLATAGTGAAAAFPEAVGFFENFFPFASGRPMALVAGLTGAFWLVALPLGWFPGGGGAGAGGWRAGARRFLGPLGLALAGLALGLAVAARVEPFPLGQAAGAAAALAAQVFSAWAVARRASGAYAPLFGGLNFLLPFGGWLLGQFAAMLGHPAPVGIAWLGLGSYFSCLASLVMPGGGPGGHGYGTVAVFGALQIVIGAGALIVLLPRRQA